MEILNYIIRNYPEVLFRAQESFIMVSISVFFAILIGIPLGILFSRKKFIGEIFIYFSSILFTIPSIALFGLMLPILSYFGEGVGKTPAVIAVIIYSLAPIIRNTYSGITNIDTSMIEAANGMGMSPFSEIIYA